MSFHTKMKPLTLAVLAVLGTSGVAHGAEKTLPEVTVQGQAERADGPVTGYRASRSATFTKTDTPLKEIPASITVVPEQLIKDQAMQGIADVLRYVPGAHGAQGESNRDQVVLRGINTTADFFVDGIRDDAQIFRDLYNVERVEVLKGPGGMAFGRGGAGGVINRVTKKPVFGRVGEASVSFHSDIRARTSVDVGNKISDSAAWRLNAMVEDGDSFRDGVELQRYAINPTATWILSPATALTLGFEHAHDERTADRGIPSFNGAPYETGTGTFFGNADQSVSRSDVNGFSAVLDHDLGGGTQIKNSLRVTSYDKFYQNVYAAAAVTGGSVRIQAYNSANDRTNIFNQTDLTTKFTAGGLDHTLLTGLELGRQDSDNVRQTGTFGGATFTNVPATAPYAVATAFAPSATDANNTVKGTAAALYVQDQISLTKQWKLLAGLRYDYFKVDLDDKRAAPTDLARSDTAFSPRLGLIWSPTSASTYYASYSTAFLPSGEQLSLATNNAQLGPETAKNYEIGARWDLLPKLTLSAAVFRTDRDDVKTAHPTLAGVLELSGQQRTEGVEVSLQGELTNNWDVFAGYAHLDGRITRGTIATTGKKIGLVPENSFSVWNKFALGGGWSTGLGVVYQSAAYASNGNTVKLPSFARTDGAVYYNFSDNKTRLALNVENLFDKKYYPTAHNDNNISPGAPRNARLTLTRSF